MNPLRILIADDHPLFRKGMRTLLESMSEIEVVGQAATGPEAVEMATALQPDLVLMDLQMPEGSGLAAIRRISRTSPHIRILVVTLFEDDDSVFAAVQAGARGYILKDTGEEEMMRAIRAVGDGEAIFSPAIATRLMDYFSASRAVIPAEVFPELTEREREILSRIARGETNAQIAEQLTISLKTVRNHVTNIYSKLQVADRAQAVIRAREAGL
ncbi:MAG: response regulator transcription factor [Anaerolineales bacterium]|nr:response regulator transcription factor [Anaerolineales bacterium]